MKREVIVVGTGYYSGQTGYNIHTDNFFTQLSQLIQTIEIDLQDTQRTNEHKQKEIRQLLSKNQNLRVINIHLNYANLVSPLLNFPGEHILYTVWESTRFPDDWLLMLRQIPHIWIPSKWGKKQLSMNGINSQKIRVVPEGVLPETFNPAIPAMPSLASIEGYKFVHVGKFEERKGTKLLLRSFDAEFKDHSNVYLVLLSHNPFIRDFNLGREVARYAPNTYKRVLTLDPVAHHNDVARIYAACDAAIFPTRAEGWGLPIIEAMACGLPTIVTGYSAPTDYANADNAYLLDYTLVDIKTPYFVSAKQQYGQWAEPDTVQLRKYMRYLYEHPEEARTKGQRAAKDIRENWTWCDAACKAKRIIDQL